MPGSPALEPSLCTVGQANLAAEEAELVRRRRDWPVTVVPSLRETTELLLNVYIIGNTQTATGTESGCHIFLRDRAFELDRLFLSYSFQQGNIY